MTAGRERVHLVVLGFLAYVALLALGVYTLALHPPRIQPAPPAPAASRGLYAADGTPSPSPWRGSGSTPWGGARASSWASGSGPRAGAWRGWSGTSTPP